MDYRQQMELAADSSCLLDYEQGVSLNYIN